MCTSMDLWKNRSTEWCYHLMKECELARAMVLGSGISGSIAMNVSKTWCPWESSGKEKIECRPTITFKNLIH